MKNHPLIRGFFDLQVNGYKGVDFSSPALTTDEFVFACRELFKTGTVGFLPTLITSPPDVFQRNLTMISKLRTYKEFSQRIPGFHLEGPFISPAEGYRGVHPEKNVQEASVAYYKKLEKWSDHAIRLMTVSASVPGAVTLCRYATAQGTVISLGHQDAGEKEITRMAEAGATAVTHLGNGLPHLVHRHQNPIWPALAEDRLNAMFIADGFHLPPALLKTIMKAKGLHRCIMVSDLSPVSGLKAGSHLLWGHQVKLARNGFLHDPKSGYLAASSFTLLKAANYLLHSGLAGLAEIHQMGFLNPLRLLGLKPANFSATSFSYSAQLGLQPN